MIKFVDKNQKDKNYGDELLARCTCGCGILSFMTLKGQVENGGTVPVLQISHYRNDAFCYNNTKLINEGANLWIVDPSSIIILYGLMTKIVNGGQGYVQSIDGNFVGVDASSNEDGSLGLFCVPKEKYIQKIYKRGIEKAVKGVAWHVLFEKEEAQKISGFIFKFLEKNYKDELLQQFSKETQGKDVDVFDLKK